MIKRNINGIDCFLSELFLGEGVPHAFTSRRGGVSKGDFESLNVSTRRKGRDGECDKYENTVENFRRVTAIVGASVEKSVCAHQVHGNNVLELDESFAGMGILRTASKNIDADGLFLPNNRCGIGAICVKSADCTPILLADKKRGSVCALHSGWRGTVLDITGEAVRRMIKDGSRPEDILCAVGPCIGACCYEVSRDVYVEAERTLKTKNAENLMEDLFLRERETENGTKYDFDIGKMCASLAILAGVPRENVDFFGICTCCATDKDGRVFFSHRGQGGNSGTFASVIAAFEPS